MASNRQEARTRNQQQDIFALSTHAPTPAPFPSAETPFRGTPSPLPSPLAPPRSPLASGYFQPHRDLYTSHEPPPHPAGQPPASLPSGHAMRPPEGPISQPFGHQQFPIFQSPSAPTTPGRSPGLEPRLAPPPSYEAHAFQSSLPGFPPGAPPNAGRFPRWRGWLEKRAVERHLARQDAATDASGMRRKKSWGAGVNDPDAVSDDDEDSDGNDDESQAVRNLPALPPLHLHHFGSRFIPHLQSQPLCSAFLDVPRADSLQPNRPLSSYPRRMRSSFTRKVLLIGTVEGLYALETREVPTSRQRAKERSKESDRNEDWNQDVRCVQVWSGLGLFQLSILSSSNSSNTSSPYSAPSSSSRSSTNGGILLGLTLLSSKSDAHAPLTQLSAQAGAVFESLASGAGSTFSTNANASSIQGPSFGDVDMATAQFGSGAGGAPGKAVPHSGTGMVRMWNLDAIRIIVGFALDGESHEPLDLLGAEAKRAKSDNRKSLGSALRKAWAMLGDPSSERSQARRHHERRTASDGNGIVEAFPQKFAPTSPRVAAESIGRSQGAESPESWNAPADRQSPALWAARELSSTSLARLDSRVSVESLDRSQLRRSRQVSGGISTPISSAREEALRLAISSVPITSPNVGQSSGPATPGGPTRSASYASLMSDEPSAGKHVSGKGKDKESASSSTGSSGGKGVLFFAIHEAAIDAKGAGTWYLALATSKTVLLYEAVPPKGDSARSWTFIKELYAPFAPKAMSFLAASTTTDLGSAGLGSASASTKLSVGSTDAPLTATSAKHGKRTASPPMTNLGYSSILKPQHGRGTAGPTAWARADLSLLLSFGRRAVIIRLSDSNVRELDLMPMPPPGTPSGSLGRTAGAGLSFTDAEPFAATHRSASSSSHSHHRSSSLDYSKDLNASTKQNWVGVHPVEARIILRQKAVRAPVRGDTSTSSSTPMSGPTPAAWSSAAQTDTRPGLHPTESGRPSSSLINSRQHSREKDLPRAPAPQGLSFPARPFGEDGRIVMDDSSSSELSDDEHLGFPVQDVSRALALSDTELVAVSASGLGTATSPARRGISSGTSSPTGQVLTANVVLLSRGKTTQVLPLPLPADLAHPRPLGVLHWSDAPTAVTAFGRIVGVERASSTGAMTTTSLGAAASRSRDGHHHAGFQPQSIVLRMSLTALAFLSSRVEMKRTTLRVEVPLSTAFASDAELELRPCHSPDADPDSGPVVDPIARPSLANPTVSTEAELEYRCGMLLATPANGGAPANTTGPVSFSPPGAAGDAGAFAFDWRGGNDYRVFYVGAEV